MRNSIASPRNVYLIDVSLDPNIGVIICRFATHGKMRYGQVSPEEVLDSARTLTNSRYGVITTLDGSGAPRDFVTSGMTDDEQRSGGPGPTWRPWWIPRPSAWWFST